MSQVDERQRQQEEGHCGDDDRHAQVDVVRARVDGLLRVEYVERPAQASSERERIAKEFAMRQETWIETCLQNHDARYAEAVRGIQSGALYRRVWHDLIAALQKNQLRHKDLVVASFVCFFWKLLGGREMRSITVPKIKVEILAGMPAPTFRASLGRLRAVTLLNFKDKHKYGFEITKWAG